MLVASAAVGLYAAAYGMRLPETRDLPAVAAAGFFAFALYNVALNHGQLTVSAGAASLIVASIPLFTSLLAVVFLGEHLGLRGWSGLAVGFCGVALITLGEEGGFGVNRGALFLLLSAASVSVYFALQKPYLEKYGALPFTAYAVLAGTLLLLVPFLPGLVREAAAAGDPHRGLPGDLLGGRLRHRLVRLRALAGSACRPRGRSPWSTPSPRWP